MSDQQCSGPLCTCSSQEHARSSSSGTRDTEGSASLPLRIPACVTVLSTFVATAAQRVRQMDVGPSMQLVAQSTSTHLSRNVQESIDERRESSAQQLENPKDHGNPHLRHDWGVDDNVQFDTVRTCLCNITAISTTLSKN